HVFNSSTDTEVVVHLIEERLKGLQAQGPAWAASGKEALLFEAIRLALNELDGAYALAILWSELPDKIVAAKTASPLVIGPGEGGYRHFMLKGIHEQPQAVENTLRGRLGPLHDGLLERESGLSPARLKSIRNVRIVACGTAHHAGIVGKYLIERFARLPTHV